MRGSILAGLACAVLAADAGAGVDKNLLKLLKQTLDNGSAQGAVELLNAPGVGESLAAEPEVLSDICRQAARNAGGLCKDKAEAPRLAGLLEEMGKAATTAKADSAEAHMALGWALLAGGRIARHTGAKDLTAGAWSGSADSFEKSYGIEARDGVALANAAEVLAEGAEIPGADGSKLMERAVSLSGAAVAKHPDSVPVLRGASNLDLARARKLFDAKDKAGADEILAKAVARLAPRMKDGNPDVDLATAHNEIAGFVKANPKDLKKAKADFVVTKTRIGQFLDVQIPVSRYWTPGEGGAEAVYQHTAYFEALRTFSFDSYAWDTNWVLADGTKVGGDNIKGLATNEFEINGRQLKSIKAKKAPVKRAVNRGLDDGYYYELTGVTRDDDLVVEKTWFFKSKGGHQTTLRLSIYEYKEGLSLDPAAQMVLDSIREASRK